MNEIRKSFSGEPIKADAKADIALINKHALRELSPEEVFVCSVNLCDDQIDRDLEAFSVSSLHKMEKLFIGKPLIQDHQWSASNQQGRIYKTQVVQDGSVTRLRASIYMLRSPGTEETINLIEAGILREVSIGFSVKRCVCSVCQADLHYDYMSGKRKCENDHIVGEKRNGKTIHGVMEDPVDAYEVSLVAVPSQRQAGITKGMTNRKLSPEESARRKQIFEDINGINISAEVWEAICSGSLSPKAVAAAEVAKKEKGGTRPDAPNEDHSYGSILYALLPVSAVDQSTYRECMTAMSYARKELDLPPLRICYFVPLDELSEYGLSESEIKSFEHRPTLLGTVDRTAYDRIYIRLTGNRGEMQQAVLHEAYHIMQLTKVGVFSSAAMEKSAYEYGEKAYRRLYALNSSEREELLIDALTSFPEGK